MKYFGITLLLLLSCDSFAQLSPYLQPGISYISNMGYQNPDYQATAGVRYQASHWQAEGSFQFDSAHKYIGNSHSLSANGAGYGCLKSTCLGAGAQWVEESTSQWVKTSWRPVVALRQSFGPMILTVHANPSSGTDAQNHEHAFGITGELFLARHLSVIEDVTLAIFKPTFQPNASWMVGSEVSGGVRWYFKARKVANQS